MRILALDLSGSQCGWAVSDDDGHSSGTFNIKPPDGSLPGRRFNTLRDNIRNILRRFENIGLIVYERPHLRGRAATEQCIGATTTVMAIAAALNVRVVDVHTGTLKKSFAGSGKATKDDMKEAASKWTGREIESDDEADALGVLHWALKTHDVEVEYEYDRLNK